MQPNKLFPVLLMTIKSSCIKLYHILIFSGKSAQNAGLTVMVLTWYGLAGPW